MKKNKSDAQILERLQYLATDSSALVRDDIWQSEFDCLIRSSQFKRTLEAAKLHLDLLTFAIGNQAPGTPLNSFYDVSLVMNGLSYKLPNSIEMYESLSVLLKAQLDEYDLYD